jgi:hypothetical protein
MSAITRWGARLIGAGMLGATAGIHAYLYDNGYNGIPKIGHLFLALVIGSSILCLAVALAPRAVLWLAAGAGAVTEAATAIGLVVFTNHTIFDFRESTHAKYYWDSIVIESIGFVVLAALALAELRRQSRARS